jgi:hypothetical protein
MPDTKVITTDELYYRYPAAGDPTPPGGATVQLLTPGGVNVRGTWRDNDRYLGWCPLPKRDRAKEALIQAQRDPSSTQP